MVSAPADKTLGSTLNIIISQSITKVVYFIIEKLRSMFLNYRYTGTKTKALNLASYNYLGFAENSGSCAEAAEQAVRKYGVAGCSARNEYGE